MAKLKSGTTIAGSTAWHAGNDGASSGLDADLLDGNHASAFATSAQGTKADNALPKAGGTMTGALTVGTNSSRVPINIKSNSWSEIKFWNDGTEQFRLGSSDGTSSYGGMSVGSFYIYDVSTNKMMLELPNNGGQLLRQDGSITVFDDNYHPNADKWTTARTLSLSGDASGSVSWDGSANVTLSVAIANDSHTHNTWNLPAFNSGFNFDTDHPDNFYGTTRSTETNNGTWPGSYYYGVNLGGSKSRGLQLATGYGSSASIWYRSGTDNSNSENGANNWRNWRRLYDTSYHPEADKWTTARTHTVTLTGAVTGTASQSVDGTGNKTWTINTTQASTIFNWVLEDGDGTEVNITDGKEVKFVEGANMDINWTDTSTGSDGDPYDLTFSVSSSPSFSGRVTFGDGGYSIGNEYHTWKRSYVVNNTSPKELLYHDGNSLPNGGAYRFHAHISGTGTDQSATAVYWNQNGTWKVNVTYQSGTSSNHPEFIIGGSPEKPQIHIDHTSNYTIQVLGERLELSEGTGTDNLAGFGTDAFLGSVGGTLRYNNAGSVNSYNQGNLVFHDGYHPNADKWTTGRTHTVTLTGAVTGSASQTVDGSGNKTWSIATSYNDNGPNYIDVATGDYGTVKVDDDRGVTWAGYAIRDDWVFMSNGANTAGLYNDTDNEWHVYMTRNGATDLRHNGTRRLQTESAGVSAESGLRVGATGNPHNSGGLQVTPSIDEKIVLSGSSNPYIRWQEGTTDKAYIQWQTAGHLLFRNQEGGNFVFRPSSSTSSVYLRFEASDGDVYGGVYATHSNEVGFLDDDSQWAYRIATDSLHEWRVNNTVEMSLSSSTLDMKGNTITEVEDIGLRDRIYHDGDDNTYIQFHANDQWRVVCSGVERFEVNGSFLTGTRPMRVSGSLPFYENTQTVTANYTISNTYNAMSAGPIAINNGVTVTVGDGETWTVV